MRIALLSPLYEAVPPPRYGGTERVIGALANELCRRGHEVTLFAAAGSRTAGRLEAAAPAPLRMSMSRIELEQVAPHLHLKMLADVYARDGEFDLIHAHTDLWTLPFVDRSPTPTVLTMHGRLDLDVVRQVLPTYPTTALVSISDSQRRPLHGFPLNWVATCYNGLDLDAYRRHPSRRGDYLAFVGRITPEKRPDWAIEIARRAGMPLRIAAKVDPLDQDYWTDVIEPMVDAAPDVEFIGEIGEEDKPAFYANAAATLFPIDWPEPFGLVMIESLAAGTPVVARRNGSVPEVLTHARSGFICDSLDEMVAAIPRVEQLPAGDCRSEANRFSAAAMTDSYLAVYERIIESSSNLINLPAARGA